MIRQCSVSNCGNTAGWKCRHCGMVLCDTHVMDVISVGDGETRPRPYFSHRCMICGSDRIEGTPTYDYPEAVVTIVCQECGKKATVTMDIYAHLYKNQDDICIVCRNRNKAKAQVSTTTA